jgi:Cu/Ag efflux pump CusA
MAIAVIGGLVLSTALSLIVVPAFYVVSDKLARKKKPAEAPAVAKVEA